jgi:archaeosine-15-forming tRNA-guanine transglycosylase
MEGQRAGRRAAWLFLLTGVVMVLGAIGLARLVGEAEGVERRIVIPAGTAQQLAAGEDVEIVPADLHLRLRDRLVVVNEDAVAHQVGPYRVAAGETLQTRLSQAATVEGFCSLHASGRISIDIS